MSHYTDRTILVTGASEGIGRALCLALAPQRPRLVLAARNRARLEELATECQALGSRTLVVPTDVTDPEACRVLIEAAVAEFGDIDALVANAGGTMWTRFDEVEDLGLFERLMRLNYLGSVYPTYYALPHLKRSRGQLVAIASVAGLVGVPTRTGYSAAKHALIAFCDALRVELARDGRGRDGDLPGLRGVPDPSPRARRRRPSARVEPDGGTEDHVDRGVRGADRQRDGGPAPAGRDVGARHARPLAAIDRARVARQDGGKSDPAPRVRRRRISASGSRRPRRGST